MSTTQHIIPRLPRSYNRLKAWARHVRLSNKLIFALFGAAVVAGIATYTALHATNPAASNAQRVYWLLNLDLALLLALVTLLARQVVGLWASRKRNLAGSRLHVRLVFLFSLLTAVPAILMALFSAVFFYFGVQAWFSDRVSTAVNESLIVAQSYLEEHQQVMRADVLAMANDLNRESAKLIGNAQGLSQIVHTQSLLRNLPEAVVLTSSGNVLARSRLTFSLEFDAFPESALAEARGGDVVLMTSAEDDRIRALVKLDSFFDTYLFVGRPVDSEVLDHLEKTQLAVAQYAELQGKQSDLQIIVTLLFVAVALLLLVAAIWFGLVFARQLASPISSLVSATERVRAGDLSTRVAEIKHWEEFTTLNRAFNRMTDQIQNQRDDLLQANLMLDDRRRFTETVLSGVSAGVLGVNADGLVTLANLSAIRLLNLSAPEDITGHILWDVVPEMQDILQTAQASPEQMQQAEISITDVGGRKQTFLVRVCIEAESHGEAVVTFDDITELEAAQRKAAWADVARRIAHEIKNPLTPIQLSAERLKRKYLKEIQTDPDVFEACTETIVRQVSDIGRMVDEFSAFARMPEPNKKVEDLREICESALVLERAAHPEIMFSFDAAEDIRLSCDRQQIHQVLINLIQNAIDSIQAAPSEQKGEIAVRLVHAEKAVQIVVEDNGIGFPEDNREKLVEPYVTTRQKGTGLGLAIVRKIMEDHEGRIRLQDRPDGKPGAHVTLIFPKQRVA